MKESIFTIYVNPEYEIFAKTILGIIIVSIIFHLLISNQNSLGLTGDIFNINFADTFGKIIVAMTFYFLVFDKLVTISS